MTGRTPVTQKGGRTGVRPGNAGQKYPPESLTRDEIRRLLEANDRRPRKLVRARDRALFILLWRTGLRIAEALALRVKDVDFEEHAINVLRGKGQKRRTVGLDATAATALRDWLAVRKAPMGAPIFCTNRGREVEPQQIRNALHRLGQEAQIDKRIHPHMFRHTFAVEAAREGMSAAYIQRQLGHSSLGTTTRYLSTLAPTDVIDAIVARPDPWETETDAEEST